MKKRIQMKEIIQTTVNKVQIAIVNTTITLIQTNQTIANTNLTTISPTIDVLMAGATDGKIPKNPSISCANNHASSSTRLHKCSSSSSSSIRLNNLHNAHDITNNFSTKTKRKRTFQ